MFINNIPYDKNKTLYCLLANTAYTVFQDVDGTFKAFASCSNPYKAAAEHSTLKGLYQLTIDTLPDGIYPLITYEQIAGAANLTTDIILGVVELEVKNNLEVSNTIIFDTTQTALNNSTTTIQADLTDALIDIQGRITGVSQDLADVPTITKQEIEASTMLAKEASINTAITAIENITGGSGASLAEIEASTVLAKASALTSVNNNINSKPSLAQIEASNMLAKESTSQFIKGSVVTTVKTSDARLANLDAKISDTMKTSDHRLTNLDAPISEIPTNPILSGNSTIARIATLPTLEEIQAGLTIPENIMTSTDPRLDNLDAPVSGIPALTDALINNAGTGIALLNHNYGGSDALRFTDDKGAGIYDGNIYVYLKTDYDNGNTQVNFIKAQTETDIDGRFVTDLYLEPLKWYTLVYTKAGFEPTHTEVYLT